MGDQRQVIPVKVDVQDTEFDRLSLDLFDRLLEPLGEHNAPRADADKANILNAFVALQDLMRDTGHRAPDLIRVHDPFPGSDDIVAVDRRAIRPLHPVLAQRKAY